MESARPAIAGDVPVLVALHDLAVDELRPGRGGALYARRDSRPGDDRPGLQHALDADDHHVVVGAIDDVVVGYGVVRVEVLRDGGRLGVIDDIYVMAGARGIGVGEAMMDALLAFCEAEGCLGVDATALPGDRATKNFFETFGLVARAIVVHRTLPRGNRDPGQP